MVGFFPDFYPDELFYSACARYADRVEYSNRDDLHVELFGRRIVEAPVFLQTNLRYFLEQLPEGHLFTIDDIIAKHTLLPFYCSFISKRLSAATRDLMMGNTKHSALLPLGQKSSIGAPQFLRFCSHCSDEERGELGECYWHRLHQTPGVEVCPKHHVFLEPGPVPGLGNKRSRTYVSAERTITLTEPRKVNLADPIHIALLRLAQNVLSLYREPAPTVDPEIARVRYLNRLNEKGMVTFAGNVRLAALRLSVVKYYPVGFLERIGCTVPDSSESWLSKLLLPINRYLSPLYHLLLIQYLGLTSEEFFKASDDTPTFGLHARWFGDGPWPCLNKVCPKYHELCIESCTIDVDTGTRLRGIFTCSICGFAYIRRGPDPTGDKMYRIGRIVSHGHNSKRSSGEPAHRTNPAVKGRRARNGEENIGAPDPEKILKYRRLFETLIAENPRITRISLRAKARNGYQYLWDNDREWFEATIPESLPGGRTIDWKALDADIVSKLPELARQQKQEEGKPHRVARGTLLFRAGLSRAQITHNLHKLPDSRTLAESLAETAIDIGLRRLAWVKTQFKAGGTRPSRSSLISMCSLWRIHRVPEVQEAIDEALASFDNPTDSSE